MDNTKLEGATNRPLDGVEVADAGEFAAHWNSLDESGREELVTAIKYAAEQSFKCMIGSNHTDRLAQLADRLEAAEAELTIARARTRGAVTDAEEACRRADDAEDRLAESKAELTRRDTVIARITEWRAGAEGRKLLGDPAAMDWSIDLYLAAAPVSLEAVKAETTTEYRRGAQGRRFPAIFDEPPLLNEGEHLLSREVTDWSPAPIAEEAK